MVSLGSNITWLAIAHTPPYRIVEALELLDVREVDLEEGITAARDWDARNLLVTPTIGSWVLVAGVHLPLTFEFLFAVSAQLVATVQGFSSHRLADAHAWAEVSGGELLRFFSYAELEVLENEGERTPAEVELGIGLPLTGEPTADDLARDEGVAALPTEEDVWALARRWSVDPTQLDCDESAFLAVQPF
jgi:hypothetical protein